jgi:hypothetical protein
MIRSVVRTLSVAANPAIQNSLITIRFTNAANPPTGEALALAGAVLEQASVF